MVLVLAGIFLALLVFDCFDFLSRWAGHFEPFKNNAERIFYFAVLITIVWHLRKWLANRVKSLKVFAGGYGLEVDLGMRPSRIDDSGVEASRDEGVNRHESDIHARNVRARQFEKTVLECMSKELGVGFSADPVLRCGNARFAFDGYAEKNGRVYIVEAKATDSLYVLDRTISMMTILAQRLRKEKMSRVTFILCVLTDRSQEVLQERMASRYSALPYELQIRTFKFDDLNV